LTYKVKTTQAGISYNWAIVSGPAIITSVTTGDSITLTTGSNFGTTTALSTIKISCTATGTCQNSLPSFFYLKYSASARAYVMESAEEVNTFEMQVAPNPVAENANLIISSTSNQVVYVQVMNALGQVVMNNKVELVADMQNVQLATSELSAGVYQVRLVNTNGQVLGNTNFVK
jgi:ferredoxin